MTTTCAIPYCNHPSGPCIGGCTQKIQEWREEARAKAAAAVIENQKIASSDNIDATLAERGSRYGKFKDHARITMQMKNYIREEIEKREKDLAYDQLEALDMICHKIGRIINGDPNYADSWVDIAGYAKLVSDRLQGVIK